MQIKNRQQWLTIIVIVCVFLFAGDRLILTPAVNFWKKRSTEITELRKQVEQGKTLVDRERAIRDRWEQMRRNTLPSSTSSAEQTLFSALDQWARESRVAVNSLTPQWKREGDAYAALHCRIDASGDIASLSRFIYNIEKDPMALKLESLELGARDKEGKSLSLTLQISGLVLNPQAK